VVESQVYLGFVLDLPEGPGVELVRQLFGDILDEFDTAGTVQNKQDVLGFHLLEEVDQIVFLEFLGVFTDLVLNVLEYHVEVGEHHLLVVLALDVFELVRDAEVEVADRERVRTHVQHVEQLAHPVFIHVRELHQHPPVRQLHELTQHQFEQRVFRAPLLCLYFPLDAGRFLYIQSNIFTENKTFFFLGFLQFFVFVFRILNI